MALLNKLFSPKKVNNNLVVCDLKQDVARSRPFSIKKEDVRVLLFKDSDQNGRKLLFDSSSIETIPIDVANMTFQAELSKFCKNSPNDHNWGNATAKVSNGVAYQFNATPNDEGQLGEMIFGTVAMNYHGVSLKFHILNEPQRLMCAKVFGIPVKSNNHHNSKTEKNISASDVSPESPKKSQWSSLTLPLDASSSKSDSGYSLSLSFERGDSDFLYDHSLQSSRSSSCIPDSIDMLEQLGKRDDFYCTKTFSNASGFSSSGSGSFSRRLQRNISMKLESRCFLNAPRQCSDNLPMGIEKSYSKSYFSPSGHTSDSLLSCSSNGSTNGGVTRRIKFGLAVIISLAEKLEIEMLRYFLQHSPQLEAMLMRLASAATSIGLQKLGWKSNRTDGRRFISSMVLVVNDVVQGLMDLISGPRIPSLWLNLTSVGKEDKSCEILQEQLIKNLSFLLSAADTKTTNFFISTLMTTVLTHHLGWVATVSPYEITNSADDETWNILNVKHPYNPLWAQLGDLYGALGAPLKTSRTIICGTDNQHFMKKLLSILTYFIRCGVVNTHVFEADKLNFRNLESRISDCSCSAAFVKNDCNVPGKKMDNFSNFRPKSKTLSGLKRVHNFATKLEALYAMNDFDNGNNFASECSAVQSVNAGCNIPTSEASVEISAHQCIADDTSKTSRNLVKSKEENKSLEMMLSSTFCSSVVTEKTVPSGKSFTTEANESNTVSDVTKRNVMFILGENEKLEGLKSKTRTQENTSVSESGPVAPDNTQPMTASFTPVCQHSKSKKHSGVKFEFDKYPQIVTNYLKSKNLEWLDRDYIGKPGNIKINNFDFEQTASLASTESNKCEQCSGCMSSGFPLQTPSNASELEFTSDIPTESDYQHAKAIIECSSARTPKTFVRNHLENTLIVNVHPPAGATELSNGRRECDGLYENTEENENCDINIIEVPFISAKKDVSKYGLLESSYDCTLLGDVTDHYIPDMVLQGIQSKPEDIECAIRRELSLCSRAGLPLDQGPSQAVAIVADTQQWCVHVWDVGGAVYEGVFSPLVASIFDVLPIMIQSKSSTQQCISFIESKLRELCTRSKTLAELLMSTDFCDMAYLTKSLNIDSNDVPLLMAIATTHSPQVSLRYGISFR